MRRLSYRAVVAIAGLCAPCASAHAQADASHLQSGRWLRVIATNDFHGAFDSHRDGSGVLRGGAAVLVAEIERARSECRAPACRSILVDGGDEFQGTPASNLAFGEPVVALFNRVGYSASALGNHEFDWGVDTLRARMREAHYDILGANVLDSAGNDIPWIPDDTLVTVGDVRVGIIGVATTATPGTTRRSNVAGLRFVDPAPVIDAHTRALRSRGARIVIVLAHAGAFCDRPPQQAICSGEIIDVAQHVTEHVDAIVSGHTHSAVNTVVHGIPIVQARSSGTALGIIDVPLESGHEPIISIRDVLPDRTPADHMVDSLVHTWTAPVLSVISRPITRIAERMNSGENGTLGDLIADAQRAAARADVAIMNPGGVRAALDAGLVTYGSAYEVQPFGNLLVKVSLRGRDLRAYFERVVSVERRPFLSGAVVTYDPARPRGARVLDIRMSDGRALDDSRTYTVVMNDFLAAGGDGLGLTNEQGALGTETLGVDLDALIDYLRALPSPVHPPHDARLVTRSP